VLVVKRKVDFFGGNGHHPSVGFLREPATGFTTCIVYLFAGLENDSVSVLCTGF